MTKVVFVILDPRFESAEAKARQLSIREDFDWSELNSNDYYESRAQTQAVLNNKIQRDVNIAW